MQFRVAAHAAMLLLLAPIAVAAAPMNLLALAGTPGKGVKLRLQSTERHPALRAELRVDFGVPVSRIQLQLNQARPAIDFGGEINTYVAWAISPEGFVFNLGELLPHKGSARLEATVPLNALAMVITAEPHFLVDRPSELIVAFSSPAATIPLPKGVVGIPFEFGDFQAAYPTERTRLDPLAELPPRLDTSRFQAIVAVRLAERAEAAKYAAQQLQLAHEALVATQKALAERVDPAQLQFLARRTIRLAVAALNMAVRNKEAVQLASERRSTSQQIADLQKRVAVLESDLARARNRADVAEERLKKIEEQLQHVQTQLLQANQEADRLARELAKAQQEARAAKNEAAELFARLQGALQHIATTRETARGLIIDLPDILFDTGRATLRPEAREILSRIAGILLVAPEYRLSIEGHTDSTGRPERNLKLSLERAQVVRDYLVAAGVSPALMTTRGFGETRPIAPNTTPEGRRKNRRVEIVIEGLAR